MHQGVNTVESGFSSLKNAENSPICDAHAHIGDEAETAARHAQRVHTALCGTDPENARAVETLCLKEPLFTAHYGLHPWKTARFSVREMEPWLAKCRVIGEIGLDSVWCDVPAADQRAAFIRQLDICLLYTSVLCCAFGLALLGGYVFYLLFSVGLPAIVEAARQGRLLDVLAHGGIVFYGCFDLYKLLL